LAEIDLVNWTIQDAQNLNDARREPNKLNLKPSLGKLLAVLDREVLKPAPNDPGAQTATPIAQSTLEKQGVRPPDEAVVPKESTALPDLTAVAPALPAFPRRSNDCRAEVPAIHGNHGARHAYRPFRP
jgi:hypothetical protein